MNNQLASINRCVDRNCSGQASHLSTCKIGRVERELRDFIRNADRDLNAGRHYLMSVDPDNLTVEDALEAFGFDRNGDRQ